MNQESCIYIRLIFNLLIVRRAIVDRFDSTFNFNRFKPLDLSDVVKLDLHAVILLPLALLILLSVSDVVLQRDEAFEGNLQLVVPISAICFILVVTEEKRRHVTSWGNFLKFETRKRVLLSGAIIGTTALDLFLRL